MNTTRQSLPALAVAAVTLAAVSGSVGYWFARQGAPTASSPSASHGGSERRVLYWYDPMQPTQRFDKPGKSPFMDMQLIPKYADEATGDEDVGIRVDPATVQNLGIRFTTVERGPLTRSITAVGSIGFNQRDVAVVQARSSGFVTHVYARAPGDVIKRDAPLVDLLIPEWTGAQMEFIALLASGDRDLVQAARERLRLLGMPADLIRNVETTRRPQSSVTIRSPLTGVIASLEAREGMSISNGATIASVNGLATVWLEAAIPEARGVDVSVGRSVKVKLTAFPGETFPGQVIAFLPQASAETRTLRIRIELPNPSGRLRLGMFADVTLDSGDSKPVTYVASEAVIRTGTRTVAIVAREGGHFIPTSVETGGDIDGKTVILRGLNGGQRVVASGQFLIDSEANLKGVLARLGAKDTGPGTPEETEGRHP
jgi:membrane fusion protein, copper/silver efflux system